MLSVGPLVIKKLNCLPRVGLIPGSFAVRPTTVPPRWGTSAPGNESAGVCGTPQSSGHVWDGSASGATARPEEPGMVYPAVFGLDGDYDYSNWRQFWPGSWQSWPWSAELSTPGQAVPAPPLAEQQREMRKQQQQRQIADAIEVDVRVGLKMLLEGCGKDALLCDSAKSASGTAKDSKTMCKNIYCRARK